MNAIAALILSCSQDGPDQDIRGSLSRTLMKLRDKVSPSVVAIWVERTSDPEGVGPRGKRQAQADYNSRPKGHCSGTVISKDGWVITSAFNVSGTVTRIAVKIAGPGGELREFEAKLVGYDKEKDVALLKVEPGRDLPVLPRSDFGEVKSGDLAVVVGRAPDPENPTLNMGIVSSTHRFGGTHLQSDAEMNFGNVGGPIVDARGRLLGIACQIRPGTHWGQSGGVGFALRADKLDALVERLKKGEKIDKPVAEAGRGFLGVVAAGGAEVEGALVGDVLPDSPAAKAGIKVGDIVVEFDGKAVKSAEDLDKLIKTKKAGDRVNVKVKRSGDKEGEYVEKEFHVKLDEEQEF
jgi:S1-C subfamily serine protease